MRFTNILPFAAALALTGCNGSADFWSGTWLLNLDFPEGTSESTCDENYDDAECPEAEEGDDGDWTYTFDSETNTGLEWVEILMGTEGNYFLIRGSEVFPGTVNEDDTQLVFIFDEFENSTNLAEHDEGYEFNIRSEASGSESFTFNRNDDGTISGSRELAFDSMTKWEETDEWDTDDVPVFGSAMPAFTYLENEADEEDPDGRDNTPDEEECGDDLCEIELTSSSTITQSLTGWWAQDTNTGVYDDLENSGQDEGFDLD